MQAESSSVGGGGGKLSLESFLERAHQLDSLEDLLSLQTDAVEMENVYRTLFAQQRSSWEVPEIDDPMVFLVNVFANEELFYRLPRFPDDTRPRCFEHKADKTTKNSNRPIKAISFSRTDFDISWDCLTEGLLRHLDWANVFCAGGAVAGCLAPLPTEITAKGVAATRIARRKYFHDEYLPGSDIDLFLYGLEQEQAERKLEEIYNAVQAANPYEIRVVRSAHAVTLVSQYPFRHVQIVLRLYNSPAEILMGFDVDACAVGFDGTNVYCCPRTALAIRTQANTIDMTRRSPSYEMRLAKYAQRGYEVIVDKLDRNRIDPFLFEKRFDQTAGLARLLLLEKLQTPLERLRYRLEGQIKSGSWQAQQQLNKALQDVHNLERGEGADSFVPPQAGGSAELSNYSTVYLPWGPGWSAAKTERFMKKKDKLINKIEFLPNGQVIACRRPYKIHLCAVGTMSEVIQNPFPDDPPIPDTVTAEALEGTVHGPLAWLVDNPGRQQIGSFHPIATDDWKVGAYFSPATEKFIRAAGANDAVAVEGMLFSDGDTSVVKKDPPENLLMSRDFLGRSSLHVAVLGHSVQACQVLLKAAATVLPNASSRHEFLKLRLPDGRNALHLAALQGRADLVQMIVEARNKFVQQGVAEKEAAESSADGEEDSSEEGARNVTEEEEVEPLDIDGADWEVKMSPLQYAVALGHVEVVQTLVTHGSNVRKVAVQKDTNKSISTLALLALYATECGKVGFAAVKPILELLIDAGASPTQVDMQGSTCWHRLAGKPSCRVALETFIQVMQRKKVPKLGLDIIDSNLNTALYIATIMCNDQAISILLEAGAKPEFGPDDWEARMQQLQKLGLLRYYNSGSHTDPMRCPFIVTVRNAHHVCMKAFLSRLPSLANTVVETHDRQGEASHELRPLDVLQRQLKQIQAEPQEWRLANSRQPIDMTRDKVTRAKKELQESLEDPYKMRSWQIFIHREEEQLRLLDFNYESMLLTEEDAENEKAAVEQVSLCIQHIKDAGGTRALDEEKPTQNTDIRHRQQTQSIVAPFLNMRSLQAMGFGCAQNMGRQYNRVPTQHLKIARDKTAALDLLCVTAKGDSLLELVRSVASVSKVSVMDECGVTPIFMAAMVGSVKVVALLLDAAKRQYEKHLDEQRILEEQQQTEEGKNATGTVLKDQIRRINNLDLAAGETPSNTPTPDQMRLRLEAAESAALQQSTAGLASEQPSVELPSSAVPPSELLLHRSVVLMSEEPGLVALKEKLRKEQPDTLPNDWLKHAVQLRPIELAVIRGDTAMLRVLLEAVADGEGSSKAHQTTDEGTKNQEKDGVESESDENDYSEDEEYYDEDPGYGSMPEVQPPITASQLKYLLVGEASRNPDLGGMTLLQLSIATDKVDIFSTIASFAGQHALPRAAVAAWKSTVEAAKLQDDDVLEEEKKKIQQETDLILGIVQSPHFYGQDGGRFPLWSGGNSHQELIHPTPLQFALQVGSLTIAKALMSGEVDDVLLGWVAPDAAERFNSSLLRYPRNTRYSGLWDMKGSDAAAAWVCQQNCSRPDLADKLVRPTAVDAIGRTALFYASAEMVPEVITSSNCTKEEFLDQVTTKGSVTALMAAACAGLVGKVKALLNAGCSRTKTCGPKQWGAMHLAVLLSCSNGRAVQQPVQQYEEPAKKCAAVARTMIAALLQGATESEVKNILLGEDSEHSPLMLAADRGADTETLSLLILEDQPSESLSRRDVDLNSMLHLAVRKAVAGNGEATPETSTTEDNTSLAAVQLFVTHPAAPETAGPVAENARGVTPYESAVQSVTSSVWHRVPATHHAHHYEHLRRRDREYHSQHHRRSNAGKGALPFPVEPNVATSLDHSVARKTLHVMDQVVDKGKQKPRVPVSFDEVVESKTKDAKKKKDMNDGDRQDEPRGPPAVLSYGGSRGHSGHETAWYGWQRL